MWQALRGTLALLGVDDDWPADVPPNADALRLAERLEEADDGSPFWRVIRTPYREAYGRAYRLTAGRPSC